MGKKIRTVELFAGVGGFRLGLERSSDLFDTVWANQWEPGSSKQHAFDCYVSHFGNTDKHVNKDISTVIDEVPPHDLLVGGFPCQDYSVARTNASGIEGKKGVLWWSIRDIIIKNHPSYVLLENVDRIIKSPTTKRGRDFGVILRSLLDEGYAVEWRVINAAEYGHAQRRRRTFIFAFKKDTELYNTLKSNKKELYSWITDKGFFAEQFPVAELNNKKKPTVTSIGKKKYNDLADVSEKFAETFYNSGVMFDGEILSAEIVPQHIECKVLADIIDDKVDSHFYLNGSTEKWEYLKGAKKINRVKPNGEPYVYSEGGMVFPDSLDKPARTMLTSESSVNRSSHVVKDKTGKLRTLTPVECERINGFEDNWTNTGMPEKFRYFTMGNALVVPLIETMGKKISEMWSNS